MTPDGNAEGIAARKKAARTAMQAALAAIPEDRRRMAATRACARLKAVRAWREARCVLIYLSFGRELDADPAVEAALEEGKAVYVPRIIGEKMDFRRIGNLSGPFGKGPFGIREPLPDAPLWNALALPGPALMVVPGLAFDRGGRRLGRGGGYYDRFLSRIRGEAAAAGELPPACLGYGYSDQLLDEVPAGGGDQRLEGVVTDAETVIVPRE